MQTPGPAQPSGSLRTRAHALDALDAAAPAALCTPRSAPRHIKRLAAKPERALDLQSGAAGGHHAHRGAEWRPVVSQQPVRQRLRACAARRFRQKRRYGRPSRFKLALFCSFTWSSSVLWYVPILLSHSVEVALCWRVPPFFKDRIYLLSGA